MKITIILILLLMGSMTKSEEPRDTGIALDLNYSTVPDWSEDYRDSQSLGTLWSRREHFAAVIKADQAYDIDKVREKYKETEERYRSLQESLISRPGHARELMAYIHKGRDYLLKHPSGNQEFNYRFIDWTFPSFKGMPSIETVEVLLGELDDIRPWSEMEQSRPATGTRSARALIALLEDPPTNYDVYTREIWLEWRERVRNGASFSFKDLEGRYTLKGKVEKSSRSRDGETSLAGSDGDQLGKSGEESSKASENGLDSVSRWAYGGAGLLLAMALLYLGWVKKHRTVG